MAIIKLAEALLYRKELQQKVDQLKTIDRKELFETKAKRTRVTESLDDVVAEVPKLRPEQVTAAYDWHSKQLRLIDGKIQEKNWSVEVDVDDALLAGYTTK